MTADAHAVPNSLQPVDENWQRGLAIVAHPDDLEFGAAAAIARWTRQGKEIVYVLLTSGEAGIDGMDPAEAGPTRNVARAASVFFPDEKPDHRIASRLKPGSESEPGTASTSAIGPETAKL